MSHSIMFVQFNKDENSKTYLDFESVESALEGLCQLYEQHSIEESKEKGTTDSLTYDLIDLFKYLDSLQDLSCLSFSDDSKVYAPHGRAWIKSQLFNLMKGKAESG
ncbi:unnamed protein product [Moneuplotes crassus]|uniref:Enhancer of rudimentary homolog n=1 Tax=Euplotes crassus TaxID=5936 RepID=A0AAD1XZ21_EUPCR|nr:unnamed protein product [Moneuplotes crassus]